MPPGTTARRQRRNYDDPGAENYPCISPREHRREAMVPGGRTQSVRPHGKITQKKGDPKGAQQVPCKGGGDLCSEQPKGAVTLRQERGHMATNIRFAKQARLRTAQRV